MITDTLEKVSKLPPEKQQEIEKFINDLINEYNASNSEVLSVGEMRKRNLGWAKGKIWMADDFNDTPEDFKEYL